MKLNAQDIYDKLINEAQILDIKGQIKFNLGDVSIIVKQKDVVGNIMQEWLKGWFDKVGIEYALSDNTQMPPDFYLNPDDKTNNLLEVKAFNRNGTPGFDIADFRMYVAEIQEKPYMLDVDYLIFGYDMNDDGIVTIRDVWLKKVWQITRRMENYPINLQIKDGVIRKIRPGVWYSEKITDYAIFENLGDFVSAIEETIFKEPNLRDTVAPTWLAIFQKNYKTLNGHELFVPRWSEIKDKYDLVAKKKIIKAKEKLDLVLLKKSKIYEKKLKLQKDVIEAKTEKQRFLAEERLKKVQISFDKILGEVSKAKKNYEELLAQERK